MLREDQVQRYSRQILLREVGGRGQERLLARPIEVRGDDAAFSVAASYLAAGGSPVRVSGKLAASFVTADTLAAFNPDTGSPLPTWCTVSGSPSADTEAEIVAGASGVVFRGPGVCRACFLVTAASQLSADAAGSGEATVLGTLIALVAQRLALGLGEPFGRVTLIDDLPANTEVACCPLHERK